MLGGSRQGWGAFSWRIRVYPVTPSSVSFAIVFIRLAMTEGVTQCGAAGGQNWGEIKLSGAALLIAPRARYHAVGGTCCAGALSKFLCISDRLARCDQLDAERAGTFSLSASGPPADHGHIRRRGGEA